MNGRVANREQGFVPPTAEQVRAHLDRHRPRLPSPAVVWGPLGLLVGVFLATLMTDAWPVHLLPWLMLAAVVFYFSHRARIARELESQVHSAIEMVMLRHYAQALRLAWQLLPRAVASPPLHARLVGVLGHVLDELCRHDAAIAVYDFLLDHLPPDHPGAIHVRLDRAMSHLASDQLVDADDALRSLRGRIDPYRQTPIGALYRMATLLQQVRTHHDAEAVVQQRTLLRELRPLGVDAGFGYGLMALACRRLSATVDQAGQEARVDLPDAAWLRGRARRWWARAVTLMPAAALVERYPELQPMADGEPTHA